MRESEIRAKQKRRFKVTTNSRHNCPVAPNILDREFEVKELDSVWAGDITYVPTAADSTAQQVTGPCWMITASRPA